MLHLKDKKKPKTTRHHASQIDHVLTFKSHVADVTVELFISYSDFGASFWSSEVRLAVDTLRKFRKGKS